MRIHTLHWINYKKNVMRLLLIAIKIECKDIKVIPFNFEQHNKADADSRYCRILRLG